MPERSRGMLSSLPLSLRPYAFHGVDLLWREGAYQATADCPWCGKEGKFVVAVATGMWRCLSCNEGGDNGKAIKGGNSYTFLRLLHEESVKQGKHVFRVGQLQSLAVARRLLFVETLHEWGVVPSCLRKDCIIPGYTDPARGISQLYVWSKLPDGNGGWPYHLLATPQHGVKDQGNEEIYHTLLGLQNWDNGKEEVYICEGWGDALALWEVLRRTKRDQDGRLVPTGNVGVSLAATANIVAVPGCSTFHPSWVRWFGGKKVKLLYDNDWPRITNGTDRGRQGYKGMQTVAGLLVGASTPPAEIHYLHWGEGGYDHTLPNGHDVRDVIAPRADATLPVRVELLAGLLDRIQPVPEDWLVAKRDKARLIITGSNGLITTPCDSWTAVENDWRKALKWRQSLSDCLSSILALCLSTDQPGSQLFLQLIGDAGSAKTRLCEAILTSTHCLPVEKIKGFFSGYRGKKGADGSYEDYSLLEQCNHKTLVTAEGDLLMSLSNADEIMADARRFFDGSASSSYRYLQAVRTYNSRRTPWLIAGTPALMNRCQSHLGDRFLRVRVDRPPADEQMEILLRAAYTSDRNSEAVADGSAEKILSPEMAAAYKSTGGYVDYLRSNMSVLLPRVDNPKWALERCIAYARFVSFLRSRPDPNPDAEAVCREEATRLTEQFVRLAKNTAAVLGKTVVDEEVMRRTRKVALDTSVGRTMDMAEMLADAGNNGLESIAFAERKYRKEEKVITLLVFLHEIGMVEPFKHTAPGGIQGKRRWRLSPTMARLWQDVVGRVPERRAAASQGG